MPGERSEKDAEKTMIYCPRCAAEAEDDQHYCRKCGANLALVTKAVSLGDTINRSGTRPLDLKGFMGNLRLDRVSEDVGRAIERIGREIEHSASEKGPVVMMKLGTNAPEKRKDRRARLVEQGAGALAFGLVLTYILYFHAGDILARIPPEKLARVPFDVVAWMPLFWLVGLFPLVDGAVKLVAGLVMRPAELAPARPARELSAPPEADEPSGSLDTAGFERSEQPTSVTEHTTRHLDPSARAE